MTPKEALSELKALKPLARWIIAHQMDSSPERTFDDWTIDFQDHLSRNRQYWEGETLEEVMEKVRKGLKPS